MNTLHIIFTVGDPSQREDFTQILRGTVERGFAVNIFTNSTSYSEETLNEIINIRPAMISFSVYSGISEEHDGITGVKGSFQKTLDTIKKVKATSGILVTIKTTVMTSTLNGLLAIQALCKELDVLSEITYFISVTNHGNISPIKLRLGDVDKYKHVMRLKRDENFYEDFQPRNIHDKICSAGRISLSVNPYGEVFPCNGFHCLLGNIKDNSLNEIWNCEELFKIYRLKFKQLGNKCVNCLYRDDCIYLIVSLFYTHCQFIFVLSRNS